MKILQCTLPDKTIWKDFQNKTILLAVIKPCRTNGKDAAKEMTEYSDYSTPIVTDLRTVQCVVGRVKTRNKWAIIDRSDELSKTEFIDTHTHGYPSLDLEHGSEEENVEGTWLD